MQRSTGHTLGYVSCAAAAAFGYKFAIAGNDYAIAFLTAGGFLTVGVWLLSKLYMDDPEARKEYRKEVESQAFSQSLKKYAVNDMLRLFDRVELLTLFEREFGAASSSAQMDGHPSLASLFHVCATLPEKHIMMLLDHNIVPLADWRRRFDHAVASCRSVRSFSKLWYHTKDRLPSLVQRGIGDVTACRELLLAEFDWIDANSCEFRPSSAPMSAQTLPPGSPYPNVLEALRSYASFTCESLGLSLPFFQAVLATSQYGETTPFPDMIRDGLFDAHRKGLVSLPWVQRRFDDMIRQRPTATLWEIDSLVDLRTCLSIRLIVPESVAALFHAAVPVDHRVLRASTFLSTPWAASRHHGYRLDKPQSNIIDFIFYFENELRMFPILAPPHLHVLMMNAYRNFCVEQDRTESEIARMRSDSEGRIKRLEADAASVMAATKKDHGTVNTAKPALSKEADAKLKAQIAAERAGLESAERRERNRLEEVKEQTQQQFSSQALGIEVSRSVAQLACPQQ